MNIFPGDLVRPAGMHLWKADDLGRILDEEDIMTVLTVEALPAGNNASFVIVTCLFEGEVIEFSQDEVTPLLGHLT